MAEQGGDRFQAHAAVDRLGGQGVPELVGVDMAQPGGGAGPVDHPGDGVPVERAAVLAGQQQRVSARDVGGPVGIDEGGQLGVQRQVAVLVELADRDVQPRARRRSSTTASARRRGVLADPQPGAQQHLHGDADQQPADRPARRAAAWRRWRRRGPWAAGGPGGAGRRGTSAPSAGLRPSPTRRCGRRTSAACPAGARWWLWSAGACSARGGRRARVCSPRHGGG